MTTTDRPRPTGEQHQDAPEAPIFDSLLQEHGDVLADVRVAVQEVQQEAEEALDFSDLHTGDRDEDEPAAADGSSESE